MAIAFDSASNSGYLSSTGTYTGSHTCTGSNRYLVLSLAVFIPEVITEGDSHDPTYNGVTMTLLRSKTTADGFIRSELWGLVAPASGSHTVSVQLLESNADIVACLSSFTGVDQSTPTEGVADATGLAGSSTVDVTVSTDQSWVIDVIASDDTSITAGDGQTARGQQTGARGTGAQSTEGPVSPSTVTMNWTDSSDRWAMCAIALRPPTASPQTATPGLFQVFITGITPAVSATGTVSLTPGSTELEILARKPDPYATGTVTVTPIDEPHTHVTITAISPAASGSGTTTVTPETEPRLIVTVSAIAPTITVSTATATPATASVTISAIVPAVSVTTVTATPATASVTVSGIAPAASGTGTATRTGDDQVTTVTVSAIAPTISGTGTATATDAVATVTVSCTSPGLSFSGSGTATPAVGTVTISAIAPTAAGLIVTKTPGTATVTITGVAPAATGTATATSTPATASVIVSAMDGLVDNTGAGIAYPAAKSVTITAYAVAQSGGRCECCGGGGTIETDCCPDILIPESLTANFIFDACPANNFSVLLTYDVTLFGWVGEAPGFTGDTGTYKIFFTCDPIWPHGFSVYVELANPPDLITDNPGWSCILFDADTIIAEMTPVCGIGGVYFQVDIDIGPCGDNSCDGEARIQVVAT